MSTPSPAPDLYLAGAPWDSTFAAAIIAGAIALVSALLTLAAWFFTHRQIARTERLADAARNRSEAFVQFQAAIALVASKDPDLIERGLDIYETLMEGEWVDSSVCELAEKALDSYTRPRSH